LKFVGIEGFFISTWVFRQDIKPSICSQSNAEREIASKSSIQSGKARFQVERRFP